MLTVTLNSLSEKSEKECGKETVQRFANSNCQYYVICLKFHIHEKFNFMFT